MLFNSVDYFVFLGVSLAAFWALRRALLGRLAFLFVASCAFYMAWHPAYIVLILGSTVVDFVAGGRIGASSSPRVRKAWLLVSLVANLGLLGVFKYFNFAAGAVADGSELLASVLPASLGGVALPRVSLDVLLPVGISFYTFQTLSYTIDVYRGRLEPTRNFLQFAVFVTFFPQLVAGPIVRAVQLLPQLRTTPELTSDRVSQALFLIGTGLVKKVAIADFLSVSIVDRVFDDPGRFTGVEVVVALYAFTLQMYCDFSGYTDVARGSAMLMGLELPENFDRPYAATNPADFWRRWHMTLSSWLRDYLYFPLGGSRSGPVRAYVNLWITMFLIGIWHGASWTFVVYAVIQATAMVLHRFFYRRSGRTRDVVDAWWIIGLKVLANLQLVVFSRILFRATSMDNALAITERLGSGTFSVMQVSGTVWLVLLGGFALHYTPRSLYEGAKRRFIGLPAWGQGVALFGLAVFLARVATAEVVPYIYFQF